MWEHETLVNSLAERISDEDDNGVREALKAQLEGLVARTPVDVGPKSAADLDRKYQSLLSKQATSNARKSEKMSMVDRTEGELLGHKDDLQKLEAEAQEYEASVLQCPKDVAAAREAEAVQAGVRE